MRKVFCSVLFYYASTEHSGSKGRESKGWLIIGLRSKKNTMLIIVKVVVGSLFKSIDGR